MTDDTLVTVQLLGIPIDVHRRAVEHDETLRRELALVRAGREADVGARLLALSNELEGRLGGFTGAQREQLEAAADDATLDLTYELPAYAAEAAEHLGALLDEVDDLCRSGELVTVATPPESVTYRKWLLGEFVAQIREGRPPRPWADVAAELDAEPEPVEQSRPKALPPLFVEGDLDLFGAPELRAAIADRLEAGATTIVVDLSTCGFVDSVGLSLLLTTRERCVAAGGSLTVIGAGENALRLFETVGVKDLLVRES